MRVGLFTVHHKIPLHTPTAYPFIPCMVGCQDAPPPIGFVGDHEKSTLASIGRASWAYGDLRAQFCAWKNWIDAYDIIGFQQYRRLYSFDTPALRNLFPAITDIKRRLFRHPNININVGDPGLAAYVTALNGAGDEIADRLIKITETSIIVNRRQLLSETMEAQFLRFCPQEHWDCLLSALRRRGERYTKMAEEALDISWVSFCDMFIMRTPVFAAIMEELFDVLFEIEDRIKPTPDSRPERGMAFLGERLLPLLINEYLVEHPELELMDMPIINYLPGISADITVSTARLI